MSASGYSDDYDDPFADGGGGSSGGGSDPFQDGGSASVSGGGSASVSAGEGSDGGASSGSRSASPLFEASTAAAEDAELGDLGQFRKDPFVEITVTDPTKVGSGMSAYTSFCVTWALVGSNDAFESGEGSANRRYSDFTWLHEQLVENFKGCVIPPLPVKNAVGRFEEDFVVRRARELQKFLFRVSSHPVLHKAPALQLFLESTDKLPWENTSWASGLMKRVAKVTSSVTSYVVTSSEEPDPWFAERKEHVETWARQLLELSKCATQLVSQRVAMASAQHEFSEGASSVAECETNQGLASAFDKLAEVSERANALYEEQARTDLSVFVERLEEYSRIVAAVRKAMADRSQAYGEWQKAQSDLAKRQASLEKLQANPAKKSKALKAENDVTVARENVEATNETFDEMTTLLRQELVRFEGETILDLREALLDLVQSFVDAESELIECWRDLMPSVKAINTE